MNTHKSAFTIFKTELFKPTTQRKTGTIERLSSLDVFTSSHNESFVFSPYPLQKSTISRAQAGLLTCTFTFNSTSSNHCFDWQVVTMTQIDNFYNELTLGSPSHCQH